MAITTSMTPSNISAREGGVDRKSALNAPTISKVALLRIKRRIRVAIPHSRVRWQYGVVLNGFAVVVPRTELTRLGRGLVRVEHHDESHSSPPLA